VAEEWAKPAFDAVAEVERADSDPFVARAASAERDFDQRPDAPELLVVLDYL